jgi:hypothetical protein
MLILCKFKRKVKSIIKSLGYRKPKAGATEATIVVGPLAGCQSRLSRVR